MELIHIALTELGRRSRSVELTHAESGLERGLRPDEVVLVKDIDGAGYVALVRDITREGGGLRYRLELGGRVEIPDRAVGEASRRIAEIPGTRMPRSGGASPAG